MSESVLGLIVIGRGEVSHLKNLHLFTGSVSWVEDTLLLLVRVRRSSARPPILFHKMHRDSSIAHSKPIDDHPINQTQSWRGLSINGYKHSKPNEQDRQQHKFTPAENIRFC